MYQVNHVMKLDGKKFYDISVWNMFGRQKMLAVMLLIIYTIGLGFVVTALPALKEGQTNSFIINAGIGIIMLVMGGYLLYGNLNRLKKISRNEEHLAKTEKHIKMDESQITNYRVSVSEQVSYQWKQVVGIYDRPEEIVLCMKDKQILVLEKDKLQKEELQFIKAKADVLGLWKKSVSIKLWAVIAAVIGLFMIAAGVSVFL